VPRDALTVDEIMTILPVTPGRIAELTAGLTPVQLTTPPEPEAWSINDILAHLRASDDILGGNILRILAEGHPAWKRMSPRAWMRKTDYPTWTFEPAFAAFRKQRDDLLAVIEPLPADAWERTATVNEFGSNVERTALFFGDWLAGHEQVHLTQIEATAAALTT
jgi:hypothetical protein